MTTKLKIAIVRSGRSQFALARELNITETRLSRLAQGRLQPTTFERVALSEALGVPEEELFDGTEGGP